MSAALWFGLVLGLRHALEPDHLTVIATILAETGSLRRMLRVGIAWGVGHCASILGVALILGALQARMPPRLESLFELAVIVMLLGLGARSLVRAWRGAATPAATLSSLQVGRWAFTRRGLTMGLVHGLAGSGLLTAMVTARFPGVAARLVFVLLFGLGATLGMALLSGLVGAPLARAARAPASARAVTAVAGLLSLALGLWWSLPLVRALAG